MDLSSISLITKSQETGCPTWISQGLKVVSRSKILLTVGTFKWAPKILKEKFYQIFVIHAEFTETGEIFPCLFCLIEHRKKENYDELYKTVRNLISDKGWSFRVMSDGGRMYIVYRH